jgi:hypothetical protein
MLGERRIRRRNKREFEERENPTFERSKVGFLSLERGNYFRRTNWRLGKLVCEAELLTMGALGSHRNLSELSASKI